jgi:hypothetical protein
MRCEGLAGEGVHCAGLLEESGVELPVTRMEAQSCSEHTNLVSALGSTEERSDALSCELQSLLLEKQQTSYNIRIFRTTIDSQIYR